MAEKQGQKTVCFFPLNSPGHINSGLAIADRLKQDFGHRSVFLLLGPMIGNSIRDHGHELIILDEAKSYEDYEIEASDDPCEPVDEEAKQRQGIKKRVFAGVFKWPQLVMRNLQNLQLDPVEGVVRTSQLMIKYVVAEMMDNHDNYESALKAIAPDLIIVDAYHVPPCVQQFPGNVPWIRLFSANPLMLTESKLPGGVKVPPMCGFKLYTKRERELMRNETPPTKWQELVQEWAEKGKFIYTTLSKANTPLTDFLAKHNCEPLAPGQPTHNSPHLNIYMYPSALDYDQDDDLFSYSARWLRCDSLMRKQEKPSDSETIRLWAQKLTSILRNKEALVFFSLGSIASGNLFLMQRYVEMLKHDKRRLYVVSKGVNGDKYDLCPDNMIGGNYIPQQFFLERANLAIIHGGNNSITECMYYGVPMIVLPVFADQLDNAQRVEDLGYGRRLDISKCTREELFQAIESISNDRAMIERMRDVGRAMQSGDDIGKATILLNKLLLEKKLDQKDIDASR